MTNIYCMNAISQKGLDLLSDDYQIVDSIEEADAVLVRSANMRDMEIPDRVKAIARAGAGVNNIPLDECAQRGIVVFNSPGANANAVKEAVITGMLLACRDMIGGSNWVKEDQDDPEIATVMEKKKKEFAGSELLGKKLGVIGLGAVGAAVANTGKALGMSVMGYDPFISILGAWHLDNHVEYVESLELLFSESDFISIHVPLMNSTKHMINDEAFSKMKDGVVLLNFARDLLVDDDALERAIASGKIRRYVTDFPNPKTAKMDKVIAFPHLGASTTEAEDNCAKMAVRQIREYMEKGNIINSVNFPLLTLDRTESVARAVIFHKNVHSMLATITTVFADHDVNIANIVDKSRGDNACLLIDLDSPVTPEIEEDLRAVPGVFGVRIVK